MWLRTQLSRRLLRPSPSALKKASGRVGPSWAGPGPAALPWHGLTRSYIHRKLSFTHPSTPSTPPPPPSIQHLPFRLPTPQNILTRRYKAARLRPARTHTNRSLLPFLTDVYRLNPPPPSLVSLPYGARHCSFS